MMKSQFDPVLMIEEGFLNVLGPFDQGPDDDTELTVKYLCWRLDQGEETLTGTIQAWGSVWRDRVELPEHWVEGPAEGKGIVVSLRRTGVETFSWSSEVVLQRAG
ncbi:MAG: hypothetical protein QOI80_3147 [Solirubrobacteraceae bacterium]|nr:hypothetical protein [Solirubrobacteraceae bacterium]